jgi:hypothetical protein
VTAASVDIDRIMDSPCWRVKNRICRTFRQRHGTGPVPRRR